MSIVPISCPAWVGAAGPDASWPACPAPGCADIAFISSALMPSMPGIGWSAGREDAAGLATRWPAGRLAAVVPARFAAAFRRCGAVFFLAGACLFGGALAAVFLGIGMVIGMFICVLCWATAGAATEAASSAVSSLFMPRLRPAAGW